MLKERELPPQAIIWTDESEESKEAVRLLEEAGIRFEEHRFSAETAKRFLEEDTKLPTIIAREGDFTGLEKPEENHRSIPAFIEYVKRHPF